MAVSVALEIQLALTTAQHRGSMYVVVSSSVTVLVAVSVSVVVSVAVFVIVRSVE